MTLSLTKSATFAAAAACAGLLATSALARPDMRRMTCEQAQRFVRDNGPVVVTTGRHTYDRLFGYENQCPYPDEGRATYVRTRDGVECPVGYACVRGFEPLWPGGGPGLPR